MADGFDMHAIDSPQASNLTFDKLPNDLRLERRMKVGEARNIETFV